MLDYINLKIIDILTKNSTTPFVEIAKQIGVSDATIHQRVKRLFSIGVIKKFTVAINHDLVDYDLLVFIGIKIEEGIEINSVIKEISKINEVLEIHEIYGNFDILIKIRTRDKSTLRKLIVEKIRNIKQVYNIELMQVVNTSKEESNISLEHEISERSKDLYVEEK